MSPPAEISRRWTRRRRGPRRIQAAAHSSWNQLLSQTEKSIPTNSPWRASPARHRPC